MIKFKSMFALIAISMMLAPVAEAEEVKDPHYLDIGFFDIHFCHCPSFVYAFAVYQPLFNSYSFLPLA